MFEKRLLAFAFVIAVAYAGIAGAVSVSLVEINDTFARVDISNAVDLYSYEINLDYTGTIGSITFFDFLASDGASTTKGSSTRNSILSVYESRIDNNQQGITGSGSLFNISHSGELDLMFALFISNDSTEENVYYNGTVNGGSSGGSTGGSSESGGGGGGATFTLDKDLIDIKIKQGERQRESFVINNPLASPLSVALSVDEISEFVALSEESLTLPGGKGNEINVDFFASEDEIPGIYTGKINVKAGSLTKSVNVILEVLDREPLFDVRSSLVKDELVKGEPLRARISLINIGDFEMVDVKLEYFVRDFDGNELILEEETIGVNGGNDIDRKFNLPRDLPLGEYVFAVRLTDSDGKIATSANPFSVVEGTYFSPYIGGVNVLVWLFVGILVVAIIILIIIKVKGRKSKRKVASANKKVKNKKNRKN